MTNLNVRHSTRSDIQGLRGIAVILVIIGHVYPSVLPGGFIGVDVFFVISGYVITQQLKSLWVTDRMKTITIFYTRRILRILPSALLVVLVSVLSTRTFLGPVFGLQASADGFWSTVFLANFHFAALSQDYFASGAPQSVLQHFWSLSIEEQFYLVWPLTFILSVKFLSSQNHIVLFVGTIFLVSFIFCIANLYLFDGQNFFSTAARAWQLLFGCLLGLVNPAPRGLLIFRLTSLVTLFLSAALLNQTMNWPSLSSFIVVIAALVLCYPIGNQRNRLLDSRPLRYIGDVSFLLYLWHWPILTISRNYFQVFKFEHTILVLSLTLLISAIMHKTFEQPIRRNQRLIANPQITIFGGIILTLITAVTMRSL
jgi:peptidoglycan/LPS O-acetylase OafA/YrhL